MRAFKKVWAEFSNQKTGHLEKHRFGAFFSVCRPRLTRCRSDLLTFPVQKLSGVFEVRVYPVEYSVGNILSVCREPTDVSLRPKHNYVEGVDLEKLERILDQIDFAEVRKKKVVYNRLYHEASISHKPGLGISFTDMLTLLAHHKLIVDAEALV